jgi:VCBS repeat-containing protein
MSFGIFLFLGLLVSSLCFSALAQAQYTLTLKINDGPTQNAVLVNDGTTTTQYGPHPSQDTWNIAITSGVTVTLTAIPEATPDKWYFTTFDGSVISTLNPTSFIMNADKNIQAKFAKGDWTVTLTNPGTGSGTVKWGVNGAPWLPAQHLAPAQVVYIGVKDGDYINFNATLPPTGPDTGSTFTGWGGHGTSVPPDWYLSAIHADRSVTATFTNNAPTISNISDQTINEDNNTGTLNFTVGDTETPAANLVVTASSSNTTLVPNNVANLTLGGSGAGRTLVVTPTADQSGTATITVTVQDEGGRTAFDTFLLTVNALNDAPVAVDDTGSAAEAGTSNVVAPGVLGNDTDVESNPLTVASVNGVPGNVGVPVATTYGTVTLNANGSYTYVHGGTENFTDTFTYTVSDGTDTSLTPATVTITVTPVNDAPVITGQVALSTPEETPLTITLGNLTVSDPDNAYPAGFTLAVQDGINYAHTADTITPALDFNGTLTVPVIVNDGTADSGPYDLTVSVTTVNDAPVAADDSYSVDEDNMLSVAVPGVLTNDSDSHAGAPSENNLPLAVSLVTDVSNGTLILMPDGSFDYIPGFNFNGSDSFTYSVQDSLGAVSNTVTVAITVNSSNDAPTFDPVSNPPAVDEDSGPQTVAGFATGMSPGPANESSQTLTFNVTGNSNPALFSSAPFIDPVSGDLTYTPAPDANGSATITITLQDNGGTANGGNDTSAPQTFTITVAAVNDPPFFVKGVDQVVDEDPGPVIETAWATGISAGPADENLQTLTFFVSNDNNALFSSQPTVDSAGNLLYTPAPDANGWATVTIYLQDSGGGFDSTVPETFTITVNASNDAPSFSKGLDVAVAEDSGFATLAAWATALSVGPATAFDEMGQTLVFNVVSNDNAALFSVQPAVDSSSGNLTFQPAPNANGVANVSISLQDDGGTANGGVDTSAPQSFVITVTAVNDPPSFSKGANQVVNEDPGAVTATGWASSISAGAANESGQTLTFVVNNDNAALFTVQPAVDSATGNLTFTPAGNMNGVATASVFLQDNGGGTNTSATETFTITVNAVNDEPAFVKGSNVAALEDSGVTTILGWATGISAGPADESGQTVTFFVSNTNNGLFASQPAINSAGDLTFATAANAYGVATVNAYLTDNGGTANGGDNTSPTQSFTITITPVNDEPSFTKGANQTVNEDSGPRTVNPWATALSKGAANEGAQTLTFTATNDNNLLFSAQPAVNASGVLTFTPAANANGTATVSVYVQDNGGTANGGDDTSPTQTFTITVNSVNDRPTFTDGPDQVVNEDSGPQTVVGWATGMSSGPANESSQALTFNVTGNTNSALFSVAPAVDATTGTLTYTPAADANGTATITLVLKDDGGTANGGFDTSFSQNHTITVNAVNDAPSFTKGANQTVNEDSGAQTVAAWATAISKGPANESGQTLTFVVSNDNNPLFSVQPAVNATSGNLTFTPAANANGIATVSVYLQDNGSAVPPNDNTSPTETFTITVTAVNDRPTFTKGADQVVNEDSGAQTVVGWATALSNGPANESAQALLAFSVTGNTNPALFSAGPAVDAATGTLTYTPAANANGSAAITITLQDDGGTANGGQDTSLAQSFNITVTAVNDAPLFTKGPDQTVNEDAGPQSVVGWATGISRGPADESGQTFLGFNVISNSNPGLFSAAPAVDAATGTLTYTPASNAYGVATIGITLQDGGGVANGGQDTSAPQTFTITVNSVNDAPVAQFGAAPTSGTGPLAVAFTDASYDIDNAIVAWNWNFGDGGTSAVQNPNYTYTRAGNFTAQLTVTDADGATHSATTSVTVIAGVSVNDVTASEGGTAAFNVSLTVPPYTGNTVTVNYATSNGTAAAAADYTAASGTLTFNAGESVKPVSVAVINDTTAEPAEDFFVDLSGASANAVINDNQGRCEIAVDDVASVSISDVTVNEGDGSAVFTVALSTDASFVISMDFATADNTASAGGDYTTTVGSLAFAAGDTSAIITVPILNPVDREPTETFFVNLSNLGPGGGSVAFSKFQGTGTILDNDYRLTIVKDGSAADVNCSVSASVGSLSGAGGGSGVNFFADYDGNDVVTLTADDTYNDAIPAAGSVFKAWSGGASGSAYTTTVAMTSDKTVTATFNATYPFTIEDTGTGAGRASVTAGAGADPRFPGGTISGPTSATFLYEEGSTVTLSGEDNMPTATVTGSEFQTWTLLFGTPGGGFNTGNKNTSVVISGPLSISGSFRGKYMITSLARTGGTITPVGSVIKYYGESQIYSMTASTGYVRSDTVIDGFSQGALASYTFNNLSNNHSIIAVFQSGSSVFVGQAAGDEQIYTASVPPMVLLTMGRDHKLYYEAYNDSSDLNGDGTLDVGYNPAIDYYGYYDSYKVYKYDSVNKRFYPVRVTSTKKVDPAASDEWSGDFLNYVTMSRMDALRKVLYGGYRATDTASLTVLERAYIPQDAHSWGKEYESVARDGFDIREYTPLNLPADGTRHLFANTSLAANDHHPMMRVLNDSAYRIWEWVSIERPVAGTKCLDGGSGPDCAWAGGAGTMHPGHPGNHTQFQLLLARYGDPDVTPDPVASPPRANEFGRGPVTTINGTRNPFGADDNYLTLFKGELWIKTAGEYRFGADGDDAVEVLIDGQVRTGDYGAHKERGVGSMAKSGKIYLAAGKHTVEFRHEEGTDTGGGVDSYRLYWRKENPGGWNYVIIPAAVFSGGIEDLDHLTSGGLANVYMYTWNLLIARPASAITDYEVKVVVADSSMPETNCKQYPGGNYKPIGLLQRFGEPGKLNFGLLTGSYEKNLSGGVLRKTIGTINNEITASDGTFTATNGIISTINKMRITGFGYGGHEYTPGWPGAWVVDRPINQGEMKDWGNPLAEMMYEGLRYFRGNGSGSGNTPTADFNVASGVGVDGTLGLPVATWDDPFVANGYCAKPFILAISDINPSYDSNQLPGVYSGFGTGLGSFSSYDSPSVSLNVENQGLTIGTDEGITGNRYIGHVATTVDSSCQPKTMNAIDRHLGRTRGLCPEEPTKLGSYYSASVAYYGLTHDVNAAASAQNVITYAVALASPLPRIEINVGGKMITLVPFAKSVADGCGGFDINPASTAFQPTNTIVDFYIESLTPTTGIFRVNYEDVEQGADHDMDAIVIYSYEVLDDNENPVTNPADGTQVRITLQSESASGCIIQHMGYIISGTTADGTYLEVVDADVNGSSNPTTDVDYFLDTPPGATPGSGWNDGQPLPFVAERIFTAGTTAGATLVENPLYYAAKWGGFVDQDDSKTPNLPSEWDADGDGLPDTYFYVVNPLKLEQQLTRTFSDIVSRGVSHVAPVVSVDEANRTQSGDKLYMAFFKPLTENYWQGNLKKYGLDYLARTECGRTVPEWTVTDANDIVAGLCDGTFKSSSQSYWSSEVDGASVNKGGVGARLLARQSGSNPKTPATPYYSWRNIKTYLGDTNGALVTFDKDHISNLDLEVGSDLVRYRIINFMYGYTYDAVSAANPNPVSKREWILGDIIHSEPRIIDYFDDSGNLTHRFIAVGANDGMLHVFTDEAVTIGGVSYQAGDEIFAFIPRDLLRRLQEFSTPNTHITMVDGSAALYRSNNRKLVSGTEHYEKTLVFGERAGGRSYWALDVTAPDPSTWKVKWRIEGGASGTADFQELGYTWSKPFFTRMKTAASTTKEVAIFAAGYDPIEDGFPEGFDDQNKNGQRDTGELHGVTVGGTEGYDKWNPSMDTMGRGIFVVDLADGSLLFRAVYGDDDGDNNESEDVTTGIRQQYAMMKYSFPADISVIPLSDSLIIMYAADVYGQIWRIRYDYFSDLGNAYDSASSAKWTVKRIFTANPGSNLASGAASTFEAGTQSLVSTDAGRKTFYSPDVSLFGNDWTSRPVLYFGTGDRQHARYTMISNRIYFVSDTNTLADETDLLNLTCNELDADATVSADTKAALTNILMSGTNGVRGIYRVLDRQGSCADDGTNHTGEGVMSQPTVFGGEVCRLVGGQIKCAFEPIVYFTSYQPVFDDPCNPAGNAFIYALNASFGTAALNYDPTNDTTETDVRTLKDTFRFISGSSIPSGVRIIMRDGHAAGLISAGGAVAGVGEDGSTRIPEPPGGITPLLWETE